MTSTSKLSILFKSIALQCSVDVRFTTARSDAATGTNTTRMWANAQPDGRPAEHRWRPLFNAAKFG